jgi:dienelactone hydrolase
MSSEWREEQRQEILRYLDARIGRSQSVRDALWKPALASPHEFRRVARERRDELRAMLGIEQHPGSTTTTMQLDGGARELVVTSPDGFFARALVAAGGVNPKRVTIAIPRQGESAEAFAAGVERRALLSAGDALVVMTTVPRDTNEQIAKITLQLKEADRRRVLHRLAFITGKSMPGLETEQVLAVRDALAAMPQFAGAGFRVYGTEQGGMTALLAAAVEPQFEEATVNEYFGASLSAPEQPFDRMLYGRLTRFGDAEIAALVAPRVLRLGVADPSAIDTELTRANVYYRAAGVPDNIVVASPTSASVSRTFDARATEASNRNFDALHSYVRKRIDQSETVRNRRWNLLGSGSPAQKSEQLRRELALWMGVPTEAPAALQPRTRLIRVTGHYTAYEVMLGVLEGVQVYGHLLIPREHSKPLPAIICQHGLGGQPKDITGAGDKPDKVYHEFGARLAEQGYVVFAPYVTVPIPQRELINPIVRKAAAVGMMRTAIEVRKLQRVVDFLQSLPYVDGTHVGYYGLSYGGYSTIWMGPLDTRLKTVIISGHFNDWTSKISSDATRTSYLLHPDEDFYNWDVLHRFTHPELIAAMFPRAVMVEFADRDATTTPEWHERAWTQVAQIARAWKAEDRFQRDIFNGVHEIGGMRTFDFEARWLKPHVSPSRTYTYLLWPTGRDLPGIGDGDDDTVPYVKGQLGSKDLPKLEDTFTVGTNDVVFRGLRLRISRADNPSPLVVRYGSTRGGAELGQSRIAPETVNALFDVWYDAPVPPVTLVPNKTYYLSVAEESPDLARGNYIVYGRRPLGGQARPSNFYFAYERIALAGTRAREETFEFVRTYLQRPKPPVFERLRATTGADVPLSRSSWALVNHVTGDVAATAARGLEDFLQSCCRVRIEASGAGKIILQTQPAVDGVRTDEGFSVVASNGEIRISATTDRGVMRGVYWLEDQIRSRQAAAVKAGTFVRNARFPTRITTSVYIGGLRYTESSRPFIYTDGLLERISRDGFNGIWIWLNIEEAAGHLTTFKELEDPEADLRLKRIQELSERARRYGVDVYVYLATNYNHPVPAWFYQKYPETKGIGYNNAMCTSDPRVRQFQHEIVRNIVSRAPSIRGFVVIYDSEGFYYCGNNDRSRQRCPRCRNYTCEHLARQVLTNINDAMHEAGGKDKQLIAFSYGRNDDWVKRLFPTLPKDIVLEVDFSKGGLVERDGIKHQTGDYNLTLIGPPEQFVEHNELAQKLGLKFITKTEHAVSQEFIFVPYIPAMDQWLRRIDKIREYPAEGWFGNWCHVGYLASLPAQLITRMSFDPPPEGKAILAELARNNYGESAVPHVLKAWTAFSDGIRQFPYSDNVSRIPGPLQKGPSNPFFLDPTVPGFGRWRAWQNDLKWTEPWRPAVAAKYLTIVRDRYREGVAHLEAARSAATEQYHRDAVAGEWRIARTIESSLNTILHLIAWIEERDRFHGAGSTAQRAESGAKLREILLAERDNVIDVLPLLDADSRLGYASEGGGVIRGGLFTPELVRWKLGQIEDLLARVLPEQMAAQQR